MEKPLDPVSDRGYYRGVKTRPTMKSAQLHENIRYVSLNDPDGDFGLLIHHDGDYIYAVVQVDSKEMFTEVFNEIMALRNTRDKLNALTV